MCHNSHEEIVSFASYRKEECPIGVQTINRIAEAEGINEQLKASDQPGWVSRMNCIHQRAEEIILDELIFA